MAADGWVRVSRAEPCPICQGGDNCSVSTEGTAVWCGRVQSDRQNKGGQYFHRIDDNDPYRKTFEPRRFEKTREGKEFATLAKFHEIAIANRSHLSYWAERYCVPVSCWQDIHGYAIKGILVTPELNQDGDKVIGTSKRLLKSDGSTEKKNVRGSSRGITVGRHPVGSGHAVIIVEGASDTAAANAAGFEGMGRHTRDADLTAFSRLLSEVPDNCPIVVIVENDSPPARLVEQYNDDSWREHMMQETSKRVALLVEIIGRPVLVSRPPERHNDFCDWWKHETDGFGHLINQEERKKIGFGMAGNLLGSAIEVSPSPAKIRKFKQQDFEKLEERMFLASETKRLDSLERGNGIDADYQAADSCAFSKSFSREKIEERKTQYMFGFLSCRSWRCMACKERKLKPGWSLHLALAWLDEESIYRSEISGSEFRSVKRKIEKLNGEFAAIWETEETVVIYSTHPVVDQAEAFHLEKFVHAFGNLIYRMEKDVFAVNTKKNKPISTSRKWSQTDLVRISDVMWKLKRISDTAEKANQKLFVAKLEKERAENLISEIKKQNKKFPIKKTNFFAVDCENSVWLMCSKSSKKLNRSEPSEAVSQIRDAFLELGEEWKPHLRTSPAWTPKRTKQWVPLDSDVSPEEAREAAKAVMVVASDIGIDSRFGPFVDKTLIQFGIGDVREEEFLKKIKANEEPEIYF